MRRLETGILVAALGALLLLLSLFLDWYDPGLTAWQAFEVWDLVLAVLALLVIAGAAAELGWWRGPVAAVELGLVGAVALVVVVAALINHPPAASGRGLADGAWLGLGGAVLMAAGGVMARVGVSLSVGLDPKPAGSARSPRGPGAASPPPPPGARGIRPGGGGAPRAGATGPAGVPGAAPPPVPVRPRAGSRQAPAPRPEPPRQPAPSSGPGAGRRAPSEVRPDGPPEDETEVTRPLPRDPDLGPPRRR
ncbi:MAG: hypothetical protein QOF77_30 [Solirubrobacteraceae bacterium]|nr:hypothetical protein [Solirubrobacteraceae bacterium]